MVRNTTWPEVLVGWIPAAKLAIEGNYGAKRGYVEVDGEGLVFSTAPYSPYPPGQVIFTWGALARPRETLVGELRNATIHRPALSNPSVPFFDGVGSYELGKLEDAQFKTAWCRPTVLTGCRWLQLSATSLTNLHLRL